jgi:hypothetical protein
MAKNGIAGFFSYFLLAAGLSLATLGCVDPEDAEGGGGTGGTSLYVFDASDGAASRVLVYSDVAALFEDPSVQPSRRMNGNVIDKVKVLAWGGMCFDPNGNRLYMVSETGDIVRIERARSQNGDIPMQEIASFRLGESDSERLSNGKFGQASLDSREGILYVTETNSSDARVWVIRNAHSQSDGSSVSRGDLLGVSGDKGGTGVAAHNGVVYAYFDDGNSITNLSTGVRYAGPRLRRGSSSSFPNETSLIIDSDATSVTMLAKYGCLAIDTDGNAYLARHMRDSAAHSGSAILNFRSGSFNPGLNQPPDADFGAINNLRVISHAVTKDWLAGALSDGDNGGETLWLWKSPSSGRSASSKDMGLGQGIQIRGLALDGSN